MNNIPQIGLGTWNLRGKSGQEAIKTALELGYRHIDTADYYQNHDIVGDAIKRSGIKREEIYIVTKIMPPLTSQKIDEAGPRFLKELQVDYFDLLLVHWPDSNPIKEVLTNFEKLREKGIARKIGVSNFSLGQIKEAISERFDIYNHQFEIYPRNIDKELINYCQKHKIAVTAYSPFNQGRLISHPKIKKISEEALMSPAQLILAWLLGKGITVIPKASSREHLLENFNAEKIKLSQEVFEKLDNW